MTSEDLHVKNMLGELTFGDYFATFGKVSGISYGEDLRDEVHIFRDGMVQLNIQENARVFVDGNGPIFRRISKRFELIRNLPAWELPACTLPRPFPAFLSRSAS